MRMGNLYTPPQAASGKSRHFTGRTSVLMVICKFLAEIQKVVCIMR